MDGMHLGQLPGAVGLKTGCHPRLECQKPKAVLRKWTPVFSLNSNSKVYV